MRWRVAVLDMAGTTVQDDGAVHRCFLEALDPLGVSQQAITFIHEQRGRSKRELLHHLTDGDARAAEHVHRRFEAAVRRAVDTGDMPPLPGAEEALARLRGSGIKICLTTGFSAEVRDYTIAALGWHRLVDLALCPDDVRRGRPYPDMILTAMMRLDAESVQDVAVVGDTTSDLVAGTRSGASVVAGVLTGAHGADELSGAPHTHLMADVRQFAVELTDAAH